jgi:hypothetical protein
MPGHEAPQGLDFRIRNLVGVTAMSQMQVSADIHAKLGQAHKGTMQNLFHGNSFRS